ncbi:MAG: tRNA (adenosine(37)-N6)-threonylcarbamoyltransferase complex transferase subunit TsaD [Candidatus Andersenbacteria bacterium]
MNEEKTTTVLAIETSCDETGIAVVRKVEDSIQVMSEEVASQINIHKETGGVVPEVAAREHVRVIRPLVEKALGDAGISGEALDAIAVTVGPGLMPALAIGVQAARSLAYAWDKPIVPVHHLEGHVYSALLERSDGSKQDFPALALIVSGGHTMLIEVAGHLQYKIIGTTRDDAAGEVFDKVARMLELPYPGGPQISELAEQGSSAAYQFPRPMINSGDLDFSYSGLKTSVLYTIRGLDRVTFEQQKTDIAASFQQAVIDSLIAKVKQALAAKKYATVLLAGGVAANKRLREELVVAAGELDVELRIAPTHLCGDNGAMIGMSGVLAYEAGRVQQWNTVEPSARISIESFV